MTDDTSSTKKLAVVTGGNRGLGFETCRQLAEKGYRVLLTSRDATKGERAAGELAQGGLDVAYEALDVVDPATIAELAERVPSRWGAVDVLVNNAGIALDGFDVDVVRRTLAVNFFGAVSVTDRLMPVLADDANIVMVSSGMGELSCLSAELRAAFVAPDLSRERLLDLVGTFARDVERGRHSQNGWPSSAYRVSKVAMNALTRILSRELADTAKRVNAVCPGWVRTDMGGQSAARSVTEGADTIVWAATLGAGGPSGGFFRDRRQIPW